MTQQKVELEGRLGGRGDESRIVTKEDARENVAVIPVSGREVDATRLTISVNTSPREVDQCEPKRKGLLSRRGSPPAGPASLPALSSSSSSSSSKSGNKGKKEVQVFQLEQHCKNLEDQLDEVGIIHSCTVLPTIKFVLE